MAYTDPIRTTTVHYCDLEAMSYERDLPLEISGDEEAIAQIRDASFAVSGNNVNVFFHSKGGAISNVGVFNTKITICKYDADNEEYTQKGTTQFAYPRTSSSVNVTFDDAAVGVWSTGDLYDGGALETPVAIKIDFTIAGYVVAASGYNRQFKLTGTFYRKFETDSIEAPGDVETYEIMEFPSLRFSPVAITDYNASSTIPGKRVSIGTSSSQIMYEIAYYQYPPIIGDPIFFGN